MRAMGFFDGAVLPLEDVAVRLEDRGYQFGDGIYEATMVYNGKCFALERHLERYLRSSRELRIPVVYSFEDLETIHNTLIEASGIREGLIYFQITRGTAPRNHQFPDKCVPHLSATIRPYETPVEAQESGVRCLLTEDLRWLRCDIKSLNLLGNVLAKQKAHEAKCFEAVLVRKDTDTVTEGASSNFFVVKGGVLWTHPVDNLILKGVTRSILLEEIVPKLDLPVIEKPFSPAFAQEADEAFLTCTGNQILPIVKLNSNSVGDGKPGPVTLRLLEAYRALVQRECYD